MLTIKKMRHIAIIAEDLERMRNFYVHTLGFTFVKEIEIPGSDDFRQGVGLPVVSARGVVLQVPNSSVEIEIFQFDPKGTREIEKHRFNTPGFRHIALVVEDIQEAYQMLQRQDIHFISEPICIQEPTALAGFQFAYFHDPEGNIIELNELPQ